MIRNKGRATALWNGWPGTLLRVVLAILPIVWISRRVSWLEVGRRVRELGVGPVLIALGFVLTSYFLGVVRWRLLLSAYGARSIPPLRRLFYDTLVAAYFNLMPGGVAGEAVRGYRVRESVDGLATSYAILLVDRLAGLAGLLILALVAAGVGPALPVRGVDWAMGIASVMGLVLAASALGLPQLLAVRPRLRARVASIPLLGARIASIAPIGRPSALLGAVAISVCTQGAAVLALLTLVLPLAPAANVLGCFRVAPLVVLLIFVPLTPGGVGQREAVFMQLFGLVGAPASAAVAASVTTFALGLVVAAMGGVRLLVERATK